ncbi:unnamed protein product [Urochloa humidicola]
MDSCHVPNRNVDKGSLHQADTDYRGHKTLVLDRDCT